jgi:cell division transport system permease protein
MSTRFLVAEGLRNLRRARMASTLSIVAIIFAAFMLSAFALLVFNIWSVTKEWQNQIEYEVYLLDSASDADKMKIREAILTYNAGAEITFVSKEAAANYFRERFANDALDMLDMNPLPASFRVVLKNPGDKLQVLETHVTDLRRLKSVLTVDFALGQLQSLQRFVAYFYWGAGFFGALIAFISILLVYNTVKLSIQAKNRIIRTMRLVGATERFIRLPFFVQGGSEGLIGGVFSSGLLFLLFKLIENYTTFSLEINYLWLLLPLALAFALGVFGGTIAVRRHLPDGLGI